MSIKSNVIILSIAILNMVTISALPLYFCTAANHTYYPHLLNFIGSIHRTNFDNLVEIAVFDLGLTEPQKDIINKIKKTRLLTLKNVNSNILEFFTVPKCQLYPNGRKVLGWYAWKPLCINQSLDMYPYVLWLDAGSTVLKSIDHLFEYIKNTGHLLCTIGDHKTNNKYDHPISWGTTKYVKEKFCLDQEQWAWILDKEFIMANMIGVSRSHRDVLITPLCELTKDLKNYEEDGSTPAGWGSGRHDQTLLSILVYQKNLVFHEQDYSQNIAIDLNGKEFYLTWNGNCVNQKTHIYNSRADLRNNHKNVNSIQYLTP